MKQTSKKTEYRCGNLCRHLSDAQRLAYLNAIIGYLCLFCPKVTAQCIVATIVLLISGSVPEATESSGLGHTSVYDLRAKLWDLMDPANISILFDSKPRGRVSKIMPIWQQLLADLESHNFFTLKDIQNHIRNTYSVFCSTKYISRFLKEHGIRKLRCGSIPFKADFAAQVKFYNETLKVYMKEALEDKRVLLFLDASHFVLGCDFLGAVYSAARRFMRTSSGRSRYNVLGALDYVTKQVITVTNAKYIGADEVCALLRKIRKIYGSAKTISIILDNARYQKCKIVTELAKELNIELVYLPTYSPNLNLIERLWKFVKTELRKENYATFADFRKRIDELVASTTTTNKEKIDSLIGEKVQLFGDTHEVDPTTVEENKKQTKKAA